MKEEKFIKKLKEINFFDGLTINVYWSEDEKNNIVIDFDSMRKEFNNKLLELEEVLK